MTTTITDEATIRQLIENWQAAVCAGDTAAMRRYYIPEVVSFDLKMPHQFQGTDAYLRMWQDAFEYFALPLRHTMHQLQLHVCDSVAFAHGFAHLVVTTKDGQTFDSWVRATIGFVKQDGQWLIAHEHASAPLRMDTMQGVMDPPDGV